MKRENNVSTIQLNRKNSAVGESQKILENCLKGIKNYWQNFYKEPDNTENLHQLRIKIRQFLSVLSFFKPLFNQEKYSDIQDRWRSIGQQYAFLRELDVLLAEWQKTTLKYQHVFGKEDALGELLTAERNVEINKLFKMDKTGGNKLEKIIEPENAIIVKALNINSKANISLDSYVKKRIGKWLKNIQEEWTLLEEKDISALHSLRIKIKKTRYVVELLSSMEETQFNKYSNIMKDLQEHLGEVCDINRNIIVMKEIGKEKKSDIMQFQMGVFIGLQLARSEKIIEELKDYHLKI